MSVIDPGSSQQRLERDTDVWNWIPPNHSILASHPHLLLAAHLYLRPFCSSDFASFASYRLIMPHTKLASDTLPDLTGQFIDDGALELLTLLGAGAYGKVYMARNTTAEPDSDEPPFYAVKCMPRYKPGSSEAEIQENELNVHRMVSDHPCVITFYRYFVTADFVFIVLELSTGGDFFHAMVQRRCFYGRPAHIKRAFNEILDAVEFLHRNSIYHRDLKPENLLCNSAGTEIRLADFGLATQIANTNEYCGTRTYMSPESIDCDNPRGCYSARHSDLWAISVILVNLISGHRPWGSADPSDRGFARFRKDDSYLIRALNITPETNALLRWCFHENPRRRPTLEQFRTAVNEIEVFVLEDAPLSSPPCTSPLEFSAVPPLERAVPASASAPAPADLCATPRPAHPVRMPHPVHFIIGSLSSDSSSHSSPLSPPIFSPPSPISSPPSPISSPPSPASSPPPTSAFASTSDSSSLPSSDPSALSVDMSLDSSPPTTPDTSACSADEVPLSLLFPAPPQHSWLDALPRALKPTALRAGRPAPAPAVPNPKRLPPLPVPPAFTQPVAPLAIRKAGQLRPMASNARPALPARIARKQFLNKPRFVKASDN
ncbi:kinase-like domain-containing protein [Mycena pura]|uniref:Kinase-like domain-containing protein n=1 Tax=Mycena pura TaxID=153505 RepID=A0AAD6Y7B3_9AGAR|nr:kinase-like domain-containing protein [Mycena pura]